MNILWVILSLLAGGSFVLIYFDIKRRLGLDEVTKCEDTIVLLTLSNEILAAWLDAYFKGTLKKKDIPKDMDLDKWVNMANSLAVKKFEIWLEDYYKEDE